MFPVFFLHLEENYNRWFIHNTVTILSLHIITKVWFKITQPTTLDTRTAIKIIPHSFFSMKSTHCKECLNTSNQLLKMSFPKSNKHKFKICYFSEPYCCYMYCNIRTFSSVKISGIIYNKHILAYLYMIYGDESVNVGFNSRALNR